MKCYIISKQKQNHLHYTWNDNLSKIEMQLVRTTIESFVQYHNAPRYC